MGIFNGEPVLYKFAFCFNRCVQWPDGTGENSFVDISLWQFIKNTITRHVANDVNFKFVRRVLRSHRAFKNLLQFLDLESDQVLLILGSVPWYIISISVFHNIERTSRIRFLYVMLSDNVIFS